jgi:hypothetical protein
MRRLNGRCRSTDYCLLDMRQLIDNSDDVSIRNWDDEVVELMESTWHKCKKVIVSTPMGSDNHVRIIEVEEYPVSFRRPRDQGSSSLQR